jgi:hypothetical protein
MKNINAVKIGNVVNLSINGKLHKKSCGSAQEANELYRLVLTAREDPSDENLKAVRCYLNEKIRIAMMAGLEADSETGEVFLAGFNTPIPDALVGVIKDYHENNYPMDAIMNFWKLLMLNPDKRVRTDLFDFITAHDFSLTDAGYMVVYKAVYEKKMEGDGDSKLAEFVSNRYLHVKKTWKERPKNYVVYINEDGEFAITNIKTAEKRNEQEDGIEFLGNLADLFDAIYNTDNKVGEVSTPLYTDMHSQTMIIELGVPVKQARRDCDADYRIDCSNGLHVGATKYVESFAGGASTVLVCYVNPANVVAVPQYDHSKMRVCEYFPFAIATYQNRKIDIIEQAYFESDYCEYELEELEQQIARIYAEQLPIEKAIGAEDETRPMSELLKMIECRLVDID